MKNLGIIFVILAVCYFTFLGNFLRQTSKSVQKAFKSDETSYFQKETR